MHTTGPQSTAENHHALWRRVLTQTALAASLALILVLAACVPSSMPRAGTLPVPTTTSTQDGTTPASSPRPSQATNGTNPPAPATYEPATPTSPAKNVPKPVMPALAKNKNEAGQRAFIEYWLETYNYMRESGDTKPFLAACHKDSKFCQGSVENVQRAERIGVWRVGDDVSFEDLTTQGTIGTVMDASMTGWVIEPSYRYYPKGASKEFASKDAVSRTKFSIDLVHTSDRWLVVELGVL